MRKGHFFIFFSLFILYHLSGFSQSIVFHQLSAPPSIEGTIEQDIWGAPQISTPFVQLQPDKGQPATRKTEVYAGLHEDNLYFAFVCYVDSKAEISSRIQRRDQVDDSDDLVVLILDTYNDRRTSLLFAVNPLGTLTDAKVTDDGRNIDFNWDTQWEAQVGIEKDRWIVEIKISLKDIQFSPKSISWGVNFGRVIRSNMETAWWTEVSDNFRVSQGGLISGIQPVKERKSNLLIFPYATGRYEDSDITDVHGEFKGDAGVDLRYNIGTNLSMNLTYNPDFATVEGDREMINLTPWELRFPDKRIFFQDGNELFSTRINTFYSRRIGDMNWGGKIIGKTGKYQFNGLFARTNEDAEENIPPAMHNAIRVKRDILKSSLVGMTYADKITDSIYYRSLSFDYILNLGKTWKLTGQFVGSAPGDFNSHSAWFIRFARENNIYHYHLRYSRIGRNFQDNVNQTGYIPDDDRHELDGDLIYRWWLNKKVSYLNFSSKNNVFWSQDGILRSWYLTTTGRMYLRNKFSVDLGYNNEYKNEYNGEFADFYNHFYRAEIGYNTDEATYASIRYTTGHNFGKDFDLITGMAKVRIFDKLNLSYELNILKYNPDPDDQSTVINILGADYFFNKDLWIRLFTQNNSKINKFYFYGLFGWRFKPPFGAVYLIYSSDQYNEFMPDQQIVQSKILFLKMTYPIRVF